MHLVARLQRLLRSKYIIARIWTVRLLLPKIGTVTAKEIIKGDTAVELRTSELIENATIWWHSIEFLSQMLQVRASLYGRQA